MKTILLIITLFTICFSQTGNTFKNIYSCKNITGDTVTFFCEFSQQFTFFDVYEISYEKGEYFVKTLSNGL